MLDAIAGIDLALWDLAGKLQRRPVCDLLAEGSPAKQSIPAYLSGVSGEGLGEQIAYARRFVDEGCRAVKVYYGSDWQGLLELCRSLRANSDVAVDALWHLPPERAVECGRSLDDLGALWLECPLMPEEDRRSRRLAHGHSHTSSCRRKLSHPLRDPSISGTQDSGLHPARPGAVWTDRSAAYCCHGGKPFGEHHPACEYCVCATTCGCDSLRRSHAELRSLRVQPSCSGGGEPIQRHGPQSRPRRLARSIGTGLRRGAEALN